MALFYCDWPAVMRASSLRRRARARARASDLGRLTGAVSGSTRLRSAHAAAPAPTAYEFELDVMRMQSAVCEVFFSPPPPRRRRTPTARSAPRGRRTGQHRADPAREAHRARRALRGSVCVLQIAGREVGDERYLKG